MKNQTAMFTSEQMTGSGQSNMLDLINNNNDRVRHLMSAPHTFWNDPGHAWLEVEYNDLIILDIVGSISGFSYRSGDKVYLEEDCDAAVYVKALWGHGYGGAVYNTQFRDKIIDKFVEENIFIRNLKHFKP